MVIGKTKRKFLETLLPPLKPLNLRVVFVFGFVLSIILVNFILIFPLFQGEYTQHLGNQEGALISGAKFIADNFPNISWNSKWYLGFPFHLFSPPFLPFSVSILGRLIGSFSRGYRILCAIFYILGPVSFYFLIRYITKKEFVAAIAALSYNFPFLGEIFFEETKRALSSFGYAPWRLLSLAKFGDSSHLIALAFIPLVALAFLKTLRRPSFSSYFLSGLLITLVSLIDLPGFLALNLILLVFLFSEIMLGDIISKIGRAILMFLIGYGLSAFWYNLSFINHSFLGLIRESLLLPNLINLIPLAFVVLPLLGTVVFLIFERRPHLQFSFIAFFWFFVFFILVGSWYGFGKAYFPQPWRYLSELNMGISFLIALAVVKIYEGLREKIGAVFSQEIRERIAIPLLISFFGIFLYLPLLFYRPAHNLVRANPNIGEQGEYILSQWFNTNAQDIRVYVNGSTSIWLNAWAKTPQVGGGQDLTATNPWWFLAKKEIDEGDDLDLSLLWLRAFNVGYLAVPQPDSKIAFSQYKYPSKFENLEKVYQKEGNFIYKIPLKSPSLAQIINLQEFQELTPLKNVKDRENLEKYLNLIDSQNSKEAKISFLSPKEISIEAEVREKEGILVQMTYDKGWYILPASLELGFPQEKLDISIEKDLLGFILIKPSRPGDYKITLSHTPKPDQWLGFFITGLTLSCLLLSRAGPVKNWAFEKFKVYKTRYILTKPNIGASAMEIMMGEVRRHEKEWAEKTKEYYKGVKDRGWVDIADSFKGFDTLFHRNRQRVMKNLIEKFGIGDRYLDAGCGDGLILRHLPPRSVGIDINPHYVKMARKNVPQAEVTEGDIEEMPFPDNSFSTVICTEVLEHLPNPRAALKEIKRVLKSRGVFIGSVPHPSPLWKFRFLSKTTHPEEPFHREYNRAELEDLLSPYFEIILVNTAMSYMLLVFVCKKVE